MAVREIKYKNPNQPIGPIEIDWGHPRTEGLVFCAPLNPWTDTLDLVRKEKGTRTGLENYHSTSVGLYHLFGSGNYVDFPTTPPNISSTTPFTIAWTQDARSTSGYASVIEVQFSASTSTFLIYQAASDSSYQFIPGPNSGASCPIFSTGNISNDKLDRFVLQVKGGSQNATASNYVLYRNGVSVAQTGGTSPFAGNSSACFRIGTLSGGGDPFEGIIGDFKIWNRILTDSECEVESVPTGAFDIYKPSISNYFKLGTALSYELLIDPNTYTLTNSNISFYIDRLISLTANSYLLTNSNISLLLGKLLSVDPNTYTLTNSNITLLTDRLINLNANNYDLTNSDASLLFGRNFTVDPNTYSLTNSNISLLLGKLLSLDPNSFSLTNSNISFYSDRILSTDAASFTLTNSNISLYSGKVLNLDSNTYTLTNSDASLLYNRNFSLDLNSYTLTLSNLSFALGKYFSVDPATVTLTTQDLSYYYNRVLSTTSNSYDLIFNNITFASSGGLVIDPASFDLVNGNITFSVNRNLDISNASFTLTNQNISFLTDRKLNIDLNTYVIGNQPVSLLVGKQLITDFNTYTLTNSNISFTRNYTINIGATSLALSFNDISFLSSYVFPAPSSVRYGVLYGPDGDYKTGTFLGFNTVDIASGRTVRKTTLRTSVLE